MTQRFRTSFSLVCAASLMLVMCALCIAVKPAQAKEPCLQYQNIAPLPGAGVAISQDGIVDGLGAMSINIPVAYTPGRGYASLGGYAGKHPSQGTADNGNFSGVLGVGFLTSTKLFVSGMQVGRSSEEAKVLSGQLMLLEETSKTPAVAFGVQDILDKERTTTGRSFYAVATKSYNIRGRSVYATIGYGDERFLNRVFLGVSTPINDRLNLALEHDAFQVNVGLGWKPGGHSSPYTLLGAYNGERGWLFGGSISGNIAINR